MSSSMITFIPCKKRNISKNICVCKKQLQDDNKEKEKENYSPKRKKGTVKQWFQEKGYGWISCEDGSADVFVHYSGIKSQGFKMLWINEKVEFEVMIQDDGRSKAI